MTSTTTPRADAGVLSKLLRVGLCAPILVALASAAPGAAQERTAPQPRFLKASPGARAASPAPATNRGGQRGVRDGGRRGGGHRGGSVDRGRRGGGHRAHGSHPRRGSHRYRGHHRRGHRVYGSFGFYGYPFYGYPYYWGGWGWPYHQPVVYAGSGDYGALDLDISPEKAEVWLDGERIGVADNYDGFPRYLWLPRGTHHLVFYKEGYETIGRRVRLRAGEKIELDDDMIPGPSRSVEELLAEIGYDASRRDDGWSDGERYEPGRERDRWTGREPVDRDREEWRDRRPRRSDEPLRGREVPLPGDGDEVAIDQRGEPGRLELVVRPGDAVVYLDGRLIGSGSQLSALHDALMVDAGEHEVEVARPGFETRRESFTVEAGEEVELEIELEDEG